MAANDKKAVYESIRALAARLCKEGEVYLRADLAYELKRFGIADDSIEVSRLALEAYRHFGNDQKIRTAFATNDNRHPLVDECLLADMLDNGQCDSAMQLTRKELSRAASTLSALGSDVAANMSPAMVEVASDLTDTLKGTSGAKAVRQKVSALFGRYSQMVDRYHDGENAVRQIIAGFNTLRTDIGSTYQEYARRLVDVYGDGIRMVAPGLFDFGQVEYLDVDGMLKHAQLEYDRISDSCGALVSEISDSFRSALESSVQAYRSAAQGSKAVGLAMAGLGMLRHYMDSSERTNRLRLDLEVFKTNVRRDATAIKADMGRLLVIYKTLNDVVMPKADVYMRHAARLMASELTAITDALYSDAGIAPLEAQRRQLQARLKAIDGAINDHLQNIDVYQSLVSDLTATLESKRDSYRSAVSRRPSKPFFLFNVLTFGYLGGWYNRRYAEWDTACHPLVREYESNQVDLKLDKDELASHRKELKRLRSERADCARQLDGLNRQVRGRMQVPDEVKLRMLPHLRSVVALLRLGREIAETRLDSRLVGTVTIADSQPQAQLPADIEQNLTQFATMLADNVKADRATALSMLNGVGDICCAEPNAGGYSDEDVAEVAAGQEQALQQGIALLNGFMELKAKQLQGMLTRAEYDREYQRMAADFDSRLRTIDDRSAYVREVMRRINTAMNDDDRRQALLMLSELSGQSLTEQEYDDFVAGRKDIEL